MDNLPKIKVLGEQVASQIAAGEVIEKPASIVRELLDNSIDAGATHIAIRFETGGKRLIRVKDDGTGMNREDLCLSIARHATSKIQDVSDLFRIHTLGFRGEALASIAAVSKMDMTSRLADQLIGHRIKIAGGHLLGIEETGAPSGTCVEVRDLFFNLPVRKKFLRSDKTEGHHILDTITRAALPYNQIAFQVDENEKTILNLPGSLNQIDRFRILLGKELSGSLIDYSESFENLGIQAWLSPPDAARPKGDKFFIYINKRYVRDRMITRAVIEGYGQRLMRGQYPAAVLLLEIEPAWVDFNIHPTKQEVRFQQSQLIYQFVFSTIKKALEQHFLPPYQTQTGPAAGVLWPRMEHQSRAFLTAEPAPVYAASGPSSLGVEPVGKFSQDEWVMDRFEILGQLKATYILCQTREGLLLIDQHAAHERIVYEKLKKAMQQGKIEKQIFLIPKEIECSFKESEMLRDKGDQLIKLGLELEPFGGQTFLLRSIPTILIDVDWEHFLRELIPLLEDKDEWHQEEVLDRYLTVMACHGAIRAGKVLSPAEMSDLVRQLNIGQTLPHCPHGRPIARQVSYYEIERMFKRVV